MTLLKNRRIIIHLSVLWSIMLPFFSFSPNSLFLPQHHLRLKKTQFTLILSFSFMYLPSALNVFFIPTSSLFISLLPPYYMVYSTSHEDSLSQHTNSTASQSTSLDSDPSDGRNPTLECPPPVVKKVPVLAGVCATDPFRRMDYFLKQVESIGFHGVQNFPTVGLFDGNFRQNLEETGMGYGLEVAMIAEAHKMGLLTTPYAFNPDEAVEMAKAGADIIVAHMGLTTSGSIGAKTALSTEESVVLVQAIADAAHRINPDVIVLCHGGPISGPKEAEFVLKRTNGVHGFYGASSMERLPVEEAITVTVQQYKSIALK